MTFRSPRVVRVGLVAILGISVGFTSLTSVAAASTASATHGHEVSTTIPLRYTPNRPTPTSSTTLPIGRGISYYLSLGDSVGMWDGTRSFPYLLADRYSHTSVPGLRLIDMSCSGETTESMMMGSTCAPGGSQYDNALSFVAAHRGHIALITISIGGNDVEPCMSRPNAATCFENGLPKMKANISAIVAGLRAATGRGVPIVGMNVYDPLLGDWISPGTGRSLAVASIAGVGLLSKTMGQAYRAEAAPVANVEGAYHTGDLTHFVSSPWGRAPVAVADACTLLDIVCQQGSLIGYGDDPNQAGAAVVARAFEKAIGRLRPPMSDA